MKVALDISPLTQGNNGHKVRGSGFYIKNLKSALEKYVSKNEYTFFTRGQILPKDVDLVHYPYFEPFFLMLPYFTKYKTIVTVHDLTPLVFPNHFEVGIRGRVKWIIQRNALKKADAIITDSNSSKEDIAKFTGIQQTKIHVVYLSAGDEFKKIENTRKLSDIREKYNLPDKFALYVGDVTWNKNLPRLIEAVKKINVTLVMVGKALSQNKFEKNNSWNRDLVKVQEAIKGDERFIRLGFVPTSDLVMLYNLSNVFVMPSLYEGFGLPVLEAMSCGCPVVTSKNGSLPEVAGDSAFFVDVHNVDDIANGIGEVFFNQKLQESLGKKGMQQAKKFSWKKVAEETNMVYEKAN